jgi:hypothetical protein
MAQMVSDPLNGKPVKLVQLRLYRLWDRVRADSCPHTNRN